MFPRSPLQNHLIGCPQILYWLSKITYETLKHCDFVDPQGSSWISPYHNHKNLDYLQINFFKVKPQRNRNIVVSTVSALSKLNPSNLVHQRFGPISISRLELMARKRLMEGLPKISLTWDSFALFVS